MRVPVDFPRAFAGLGQLVERIAAGEVGDEDLAGRVNGWGREDCAGSATLAKAALLAKRYELGTEGLQNAQEGVSPAVRALDRVSRVIDPPAGTGDVPTAPVPVKLPEALRRQLPGAEGFVMEGAQILLAAAPDGWHLSFSHPERYPQWEELLRARDGVLGEAAPEMWVRMPAPGSESPGFLVHLFETPPAPGRGGHKGAEERGGTGA